MSNFSIAASGAGNTSPDPSASSYSAADTAALRQRQLEWFRDTLRPHFDQNIIGRTQRLLSPSCSDPLLAFVFMACAIDYLAGYWKGRPTTGKDYVGFVNEYFPRGKYDADGLYDSLRNGVVHMFTLKQQRYPIVLTDNNRDLHLRVDKNGQTILNAESLLEDLAYAMNLYFDAAQASETLLALAAERGKLGIMGVVGIDL